MAPAAAGRPRSGKGAAAAPGARQAGRQRSRPPPSSAGPRGEEAARGLPPHTHTRAGPGRSAAWRPPREAQPRAGPGPEGGAAGTAVQLHGSAPPRRSFAARFHGSRHRGGRRSPLGSPPRPSAPHPRGSGTGSGCRCPEGKRGVPLRSALQPPGCHLLPGRSDGCRCRRGAGSLWREAAAVGAAVYGSRRAAGALENHLLSAAALAASSTAAPRRLPSFTGP